MIKTQLKAMRWLGDSLDAVKESSDEARREAGHQPGRVKKVKIRPTGSRLTSLTGVSLLRPAVRHERTRVVPGR